MIVLVLVAFLSILVPAFLSLAFTGSRATVPVVEDRRELYAANSALDAAIEQGRADWVGRVGTTCPEQTLDINGYDATVTCQSTTRWCDLDRSLVYAAVVRDGAEVVGRASAEVVFRFDPTGAPETEVRRWDPDAVAAPATSTTVPCTGSSSTTTSTTTSVPSAVLTAGWRVAELRAVEKNANQWRAEGPVEVLDSTGAPVAGATVRVRIERFDGTVWHQVAPPITGETVETGLATFHSGYYRPTFHQSQPWAERIRFIIESVTVPGATWTPGVVLSPELLAPNP
jgi:hypothetical protein